MPAPVDVEVLRLSRAIAVTKRDEQPGCAGTAVVFSIPLATAHPPGGDPLDPRRWRPHHRIVLCESSLHIMQ
jgi:hypothetical protein